MPISKDFASGMLFMITGLGSAFIASNYSMGTAASMGPGYFPVVLGSMIAILGLFLTIAALRNASTAEEIEPANLKPIFFISLSILAFGLLIERAGLLPALAALIAISGFGQKQRSIFEVLLMMVVLSALVWIIFIRLLEIRVPLVAL